MDHYQPISLANIAENGSNIVIIMVITIFTTFSWVIFCKAIFLKSTPEWDKIAAAFSFLNMIIYLAGGSLAVSIPLLILLFSAVIKLLSKKRLHSIHQTQCNPLSKNLGCKYSNQPVIPNNEGRRVFRSEVKTTQKQNNQKFPRNPRRT